jgi:hypothetical protein
LSGFSDAVTWSTSGGLVVAADLEVFACQYAGMLGAQGEGKNDDERDSSNRNHRVASTNYRLHARNDHDEDERDHRGKPCERYYHADPEQDFVG